MNWVDYAILAVLFISVLIGLARGLISEVLSLVIWVAAFWVAWLFGPAVSRYFEGSVSLPAARIALGYGLCFIAVLLVGAVFRFLMSRLVSGTGLGGVDRLLGMLFGFARGVLIVSAVVFLLGFTPLPNEPVWRQSAMLPQFAAPAAWLGQQVPANVRDYMHPPEALRNVKLRDVKLPSREELMKLRDLTAPARPTQDPNAQPAAATTAPHS